MKYNERKRAYTGDTGRKEERRKQVYENKNIKVGDRN